MPARDAAPAFLLVHSPLVGPTIWSPLVRELERRGREVAAPSLLGIADAPAPQWRHSAEAVHAAAERLAHPVLLVGHSGAGPLLPVIAHAVTAHVAGLIFVDAFLPPTRGNAPLAPPRFMEQVRALASDGVLPPWWSWLGEETMRELVPDEGLRAVLEGEMPRLPLSYFQASVPMPQRWSQRPCAYLLLSPRSTKRAPPMPAAAAGRWTRSPAPATSPW